MKIFITFYCLWPDEWKNPTIDCLFRQEEKAQARVKLLRSKELDAWYEDYVVEDELDGALQP